MWKWASQSVFGLEMGPLGALSPHPGVSDLFQGSDASDSLFGIANGTNLTNGITSAAHMSPPAVWTPALSDSVLKIDGKLKVLALLNFRR